MLYTALSGQQLVLMDPMSYFSFQQVFDNWYNKCCGMYYLVCGMVQIKGQKVSPVKWRQQISSVWSLRICLMLCN